MLKVYKIYILNPMQYINTSAKQENQVSIAIASSDFIYFG